jgi:hypothetical protein
MLCETCGHGVRQEVALDRDVDLRSVMSCDLIRREIRRLEECSRYVEMKAEVSGFKEVLGEVVDLGYGAIPAEVKKKGWPLGKKRKVG